MLNYRVKRTNLIVTQLNCAHHCAQEAPLCAMDNQRERCCSIFWGRRKPVRPASIEEAGTSAYLPTWLLFAYRLTTALLTTAVLITYALLFDPVLGSRQYRFEFITIWGHAGAALSFFMSGACSLVAMLRCTCNDNQFKRCFSAVTISMYHVFMAAAFFNTPVYWALIWKPNTGVRFSQLFNHGFTFSFFVIDIMLSARMDFRQSGILLFVAYHLIYLAFMLIINRVRKIWVYPFLDPTFDFAYGYYIAIVVGTFAIGVFVLGISRFNRLFEFKTDEEQAETTNIEDV